jgi:RsiW-degrading membrane proteinase PrsW (M82 family)
MAFARLSLAISLIFAPLASGMAYLITYGEYIHHYPDKKQPVKMAIQAALVTFVFFIVLSLVVGFILENIVGPQSP